MVFESTLILNILFTLISFCISSKFIISALQSQSNEALFSKRYHSLDSWQLFNDQISTFEQIIIGYRLAWPLRVVAVAVAARLSWEYQLARLFFLGALLAIVFTYRDPKAEWIVGRADTQRRRPICGSAPSSTTHGRGVRNKTASQRIKPPRPDAAPALLPPAPVQRADMVAAPPSQSAAQKDLRHLEETVLGQSPEVGPVSRRLSYSQALGMEKKKTVSEATPNSIVPAGQQHAQAQDTAQSLQQHTSEPTKHRKRVIEKVHEKTTSSGPSNKRRSSTDENNFHISNKRRNSTIGQSASAFQKPLEKRASKRKSNTEGEQYSKSSRIKKELTRSIKTNHGEDGAFQVYNLQFRKRSAGTLVISDSEKAAKRGRPSSMLQKAIQTTSQAPAPTKPAEELLDDSQKGGQLPTKSVTLKALSKLKRTTAPVTQGRIPLRQKKNYPWDEAQEHPKASKQHQEELAKEEKAAQLTVMNMLARAHDVATGAVNTTASKISAASSGQSALSAGATDASKVKAFSFSTDPTKTANDAKPSQSGFAFAKSDTAGGDSSKPGFTFGGTGAKQEKSGEDTKKDAPAFSFGETKTSEKPEEPKKTAAFTFGSPAASTDKNKKEEVTTGPVAPAGFTFGAKSSTDSEKKKADSTKPTAPTGFSFGTNSTAPTSISSDTKPKEDAPKSTGFQFGMSSGLEASKPPEPKPTGFQSGVVSSGDTSKPQASKPAGFQFGATSGADASNPQESKPAGFQFGAPSGTDPSKPQEPKPGGFQFGAASTTDTSKPQESKPVGLQFGTSTADASKSQENKKETNGAFSFGTSAAPASSSATFGGDSKPAFGFGSSNTEKDKASGAPTSGFSFGGSKPAADTKPTSSSTPGFTFGNSKPSEQPKTQANSNPQFSFGSPPAVSFGDSKDKAASSSSELKAAPTFSFGKPVTTAPSPQAPVFGASQTSQPAETKPAFSFGSSKTETKPTSTTSFGASGTTPSSQGFGFGSNANLQAQTSAAPSFAFGQTPAKATAMFGSPTPASKPPTGPANTASMIDAPAPAFGQSNPFGSKPAASSNAPAFSFGSAGGGSSTPAFGQSTSQAAPAFGQAGTPSGSGTFTFGQAKAGTGFGSAGASNANVPFGGAANTQPSPSPFGGGAAPVSAPTGFGSSPAPQFGASPFGGGTPTASTVASSPAIGFGNAATSQQASPFGMPSAPSPIPPSGGANASGFALGAQSTKGRRKVRVKGRSKR